MYSEHLSRDLSKLIAAIEKEWREELGGPEAPLTESVLRKVHRLLTTIKQETSDRQQECLLSQIGPDWLESHPWAVTYVKRIDTALICMGDNSTIESNTDH